MSDPFAVDAEAYVLGALDEPERTAFEEHLRGCDPCRAAVDAVGPLPALLDLVREHQVDLSLLTTHSATLEDVFVSLTGRHLRDA